MRFSPPSRRAVFGIRQVLFLAALALLLGNASKSEGGTGSRASLPTGLKTKHGLRVNIDSTWVDANGYRPLQLELIPWPPGPAPADRSIRVEFRPYSWRGGYAWCGASDFIEIPQGATSVQATLSIPQREQWNSFVLDFYEDGKKLEDLSYRGAMGVLGSYGWTEAAPAMLFLDPDAPPRALRQQRIADLRAGGKQQEAYTLPDVRGLAEMYPPPDATRLGYNPTERATDLTILDSLASWSKIEILPPTDLPENWINLTGFDVVFISLDDLLALAQTGGAPWRAVRDLIATGPTLCVHGVGPQFSRLPEMERVLHLRVSEEEASRPYRGWLAPNPRDYSRDLYGRAAYNQSWYAQQQAAEAALDEKARKALQEREGKPPAEPTFLWRPLDLGRVVAIAAEDPFPGRPQDWGWIFKTLSDDDWMWHRRHGLSLTRRNLDYWNFLIPGVGLAPVNSFLVLISLFVVVIGPLNYWLLVRQGRLYLLLVTVPAGAFLVTMGLFGYALVTDGLGVKARLRSYTEIDQRQGRSVSWSRQSYYAALTPSRGLAFPEQAAVFPIEVQPFRQPNYYDPKCHVDWEYDQSLIKGFIASRLTSQMMVVQTQPTSAQVRIAEAAGQPPRAANELGVAIEFLAMRDARGEFFAAENLAVGKTVALAPIAWPDAAERLQKALARVKPANPEGYDPREHNEALNFGDSNTYYWWGGDTDSGLAEPTVVSSVLERALRRVTSSDPDALQRQSYVALVPHSPEVPLGVASPKQLQSVHIIVGKW